MTDLLIRLFIRNHEHTEDRSVRLRYGVFAGCTGLFCNLLLTVIKLVIGYLTGAISVIADAMNNLSDSLSSIVTLAGFRLSGKPADSEHPFGHGRVEYISGFIVSAAIIAVALDLLKSSVQHIISGSVPAVNGMTAFILIIAILVKAWMARFYFRISDIIASPAMRAAAKDSLNDCLTTGVSLLSVLCLLYAGLNIDAWAGALVSLVVIRSGITAARDTLSPLLGTAPDTELIERIRQIASAEPEIIGVHDIYVHEYGPGMQITSMHVEMNADLSLMEAHAVIHRIEQNLRQKQISEQVTIHIDPVNTHDPERAQTMKAIERILLDIDPSLSMHDFMVTDSRDRKTVSFDIVVPYEFPQSDDDLLQTVKDHLPADGTQYEIQIDRGAYRILSGTQFPVK